MAMKRCPDCGEKYSDTYKYCPFCEEEEVLRKGKDRGGRRARQSRHFSVLTPILVVLILIMARRRIPRNRARRRRLRTIRIPA